MADESVPPTEKTCIRCNQTKPIALFSRNRANKDGYQSPCKQCCAKAFQIWYALNKEANNIATRAWRKANPEKSSASSIRWNKNNPEKVLEYNRRYRANSTKNLHRDHQYRARKRNLPDTFTYDEENFCRQYFHYACAVCGHEEGFQWSIAMDHWIPLSSPDCPGTIATNMIPLCDGIGGCNTSKKDRNASTWLMKRFGTRKATTILKRIEAYFALVRQRQTS